MLLNTQSRKWPPRWPAKLGTREDYATAKQYGIDRFTLMIERKEVLGQEQWHGVFEYGSKNLKVIGTLEK